MPQLIPDKLTPIEPDDAVRNLAEAYKKVTGKVPRVSVLKLLAAQSALESGNWQIVHNFNYGNEKSSSSDTFAQVYSIRDDPTDPGAHYAAFLSPEEGAEHYVRTLTRREHWKTGLESGKPLIFVKQLSTQPVYFTADPTRYLTTLLRLVDKYENLAKKYGVSFWGVIGGVLTIGVLATAGFFAYKRLVP